MLQKEIDELKEQLGMAYPWQERYWDRAEGELSAWLEVVKVGGGAGPRGEDDMSESRLGALCALTSGTCTKRLCALPRAVQRSPPTPEPLLSGNSEVSPCFPLKS